MPSRRGNADDWAERDRRDTLAGGLWLATSVLVPLAATLVLSVVMGRVLGPEELGQQGYIAYVAALLTSVAVTVTVSMAFRVLGQAIGRRDEADVTRLYQWAVVTQVAGSLLVAMVLLAFAAIDSSSSPAWVLASLTVVVDGLFWSKAMMLIARQGWAWVSRGRLVAQTASAALGVAAVLAGMGINGVFLAQLATSTGLLFWIWPRQALPKTRPLAAFPRPLVRVWGAFFAMGALSQIVNYRIEFLFLGSMSTRTELAMYSVAFMVVATAVTLPRTIISAAIPDIASKEGAGRIAETTTSLGVAMRVMTTASCMVAAGVAGLGPPLVSLVFGAAFLPAANLIPLLSTALAPAAVAALFWSFTEGSGRTWIPITAGAVASTVDIGLAFAFVQSMGATGAAIANVGGQLTLAVVIIFLSWRHYGHFHLRLKSLVLPVSACLVISLSTVSLVAGMGYDTAGSALVALTLGGTLYVLSTVAYGWSVGFIRGSDATWLHASLPHGLARLQFLISGRRARWPMD